MDRLTQHSPTGLYIHVPFCEKRCVYCSFYSTVHGKEERDAFVRTLAKELAFRHNDAPISTLYFGGGTPSQLDDEEMEAVFSAIHRHCVLSPHAEITFEANPDDISQQKVVHLRQLGVNRISLGVQSFDDRRLSFLNRRHTAQQALDAIDILRTKGIENISIDLIFGLPGQQLTDWNKELAQAFELPITHLSAYSLMYEKGTPLYYARERGAVKECDEETSLSMFQMLCTSAQCAGFEQYEISNFARPGYRSRHNSSYWHGIPYLGLGPGAHSYDGKNCRRVNDYSLRRYMEAERAKTFADVPHTLEKLSADECYDELICTRLRTCEGLSLQEVPASRRSALLRMARPHIDAGRLELDADNHLRLTASGIFVSDDVMSDLMWEE
jgi:putative coproporphyrinogen dehydrogenase